jgi:hypothetical protein
MACRVAALVGANTNILRNFCGTLLFGYGWMSMICFFYLDIHWAHTAPSLKNIPEGLVFPHNEHGSITYFSAFQATSCYLLFLTSVPLGAVGHLIVPWKRVLESGMDRKVRWVSRIDDPDHVSKWGLACGFCCAPIMVFLIGPSLVRGLNAMGVVFAF